jgi:hypothetical protein
MSSRRLVTPLAGMFLAAPVACVGSEPPAATVPVAEQFIVEPASVSSGGPGSTAPVGARLVGWNGPAPSLVRWTSSDPERIVIVDSLAPVGGGTVVRFNCTGCGGVITATLERPGPHVATIPVTVLAR